MTAGADRLLAFAARMNARQRQQDKPAEKASIWVLFGLSGHRFALSVEVVQEVCRVGDLTPVPHAPFTVLGVTNYRGGVMPVIDLRQLLGLAPNPIFSDSRILVIEAEGRPIGYLVDSVGRVFALRQSEISTDVPESLQALQSRIVGSCLLQNVEVALLGSEAILRLNETKTRPPRISRGQH